MKIYLLTALMVMGSFFQKELNAQDPNFHIYLAFGQSNMEGLGAIQSQDKSVDNRFQVLQSLTCSNLDRNKDPWIFQCRRVTLILPRISPLFHLVFPKNHMCH